MTEQDAEYLVQCVKHVFTKTIVLQYQIENTIEDQVLSNVQIKLTDFKSDNGVTVKGSVPLNEEDSIGYEEKRFVYVILERGNSTAIPHIKVEQKMMFLITEIDVETKDENGSYDEEFTALQGVELTTK